MARIDFLPVCSNCRGILDFEVIDCKYEESNTTGNMYKLLKRPHISPEYCPFCGLFFEEITMPTKLPYKR